MVLLLWLFGRGGVGWKVPCMCILVMVGGRAEENYIPWMKTGYMRG